MGYQADVWSVERCQKARMACLVVAVSLLVLSLVFHIEWMHWPRMVAWCAAGVASMYEGRAHKRLGRDPDAHYLRGVFCIVVGVTCLL